MPGSVGYRIEAVECLYSIILSVWTLGLLLCSLCLSLSALSRYRLPYIYTPHRNLPFHLLFSLPLTSPPLSNLPSTSLYLYLHPIHTEGVLLSVVPKPPPFSIFSSSLFSFLIVVLLPPGDRRQSCLPSHLWLSVRPSPPPFLFCESFTLSSLRSETVEPHATNFSPFCPLCVAIGGFFGRHTLFFKIF